MKHGFVCRCRHPQPPYDNLGASYDGRWWVHRECGLPKEAWLRSMGDMMINFFRGGSLDGSAYATSSLLDHPSLMDGYHWTPEVMVSQKTGATARVWEHESLGSDPLAEAQSSGSAAPQGEDGEMSSLKERREALKVSRAKVAEEAGLTSAKIYRIETGGKRTTDEEVQQVSDALGRLEAAAGAEAQPDPQ